ncbi:MAG: glycosyltransferase family 1 protein [Solirubrobacterales bacterium]|nr:glycosyltransferase family 1 protein [Solirubrobacterales bacterium]
MRVGYDSRPAADLRGIGRYAGCLLEALRPVAAEHDATLVETARSRHVDVFHSPWIDGAPLRPGGVPIVVTLHDLVPLKRRNEYLRTGLRFQLHYLAVRRATRVIVPTHAVAEDVTRLLRLPEERVHVIGEAAAPVMYPRSEEAVTALRERLGLPERYLLWVGGLEHPDPRKRVGMLARTPRALPLVLAGPVGAWARELPDVQLTGPLSDDDLAALYTGAHALIFPSDEEGFGLPPVEALACGTPVVACDVPALRETLDGRATLVDPSDLRALVAAAEAAERPAPAPLTRTWDDVARETWPVYEAAMSSSPDRR